MIYEQLIKSKGLKVTKHRVNILEVINLLDIDATNKNILNKLGLDKSTFYRIIQIFVDSGIISSGINHRNELYYSICDEHKHYIKCVKCHKKESIDICPVDDLEKKGFHVIQHKIEIDGICNDCSND